MLRPWRRIREREGRLFDLSVRSCQAAAMMLAEVLLPGRNAEELDKAIRTLAVPVELPARRSGSESRLAKLGHRLQEGRLPLGTLRVRKSGGPGTHNGMRSIVNAVGDGFPRIRVGVAPAELREVPDLAEYVLSPFEEFEQAVAEKAMDRAAEAAEVALGDLQRAMNQFNG